LADDDDDGDDVVLAIADHHRAGCECELAERAVDGAREGHARVDEHAVEVEQHRVVIGHRADHDDRLMATVGRYPLGWPASQGFLTLLLTNRPKHLPLDTARCIV
jgi:hypothetical protein